MKTMNRWVRCATAAAALGMAVGGAAGADGGGTPSGAELYTQRTCVACHGPDAKTPLLPDYPRLAGQNEAYLLLQMRDIKSGARANGNTPAMFGVMGLVTDEELVVLAKYLSELSPN